MTSSLRNTITAAVLTLALVAAANPVSASSRDDLEQRRNGLNGQLGEAQRSFDESSKAFADATAVLQASQAQLAAAQTRLGEVRGQLAASRARDAEMQAELARSEEALRVAEEALKVAESELATSASEVEAFAVENLQDGDPGLRAFGDLLRGEDPSVFSEKMAIKDSIGDAQVALMQRLAATRVILDLNREKVQELRDQVQVARDEAAANLAAMQALEAEAAAQEAEINGLVQVNATNQQDAERIRADDAAQVAALEAERARTEAAISYNFV